LAANFDGDGGFFDEGIAAGLLAVRAEIGGGVGFAGKTGAGTPLLGGFSANNTATFWTNQISRHGIKTFGIGHKYCSGCLYRQDGR
jgi:hypothetical protein